IGAALVPPGPPRTRFGTFVTTLTCLCEPEAPCGDGDAAGGDTLEPRRSVAAGETVLAPGFENHHGHGIGEVEAAVARSHRQAQALCFRHRLQDLVGQAAGLAAEQESVAVGVGGLVVADLAAGA